MEHLMPDCNGFNQGAGAARILASGINGCPQSALYDSGNIFLP